MPFKKKSWRMTKPRKLSEALSSLRDAYMDLMMIAAYKGDMSNLIYGNAYCGTEFRFDNSLSTFEKKASIGPNKVNKQRTMHTSNSSGETGTIRRLTTSEDPLRDELLWRIPNEVTLQHIATNWSWGTRQVVATVSRDWQRAFQGRMVYEARVRSQTTETCFVVLCEFFKNEFYWVSPNVVSQKWTLSLFSPSEERWYKLPPVPGCRSGLLDECQRVFLDCAMYVLGGTRSRQNQIPSGEVHVLDLAKHSLEWRRCANMLVPRLNFHTGVMHGKIFIFGGTSKFGTSELSNEVYDPKVDGWSCIAPIIPSASFHSVFSVGQQIFVCSGSREPGYPAVDNWRSLLRRLPQVSDKKADNCGDTKLVVTDGPRGPMLIRTSDDIEDEMDGLHEIVKNRLVDLEKGETGDFMMSPAEHLASHIRSYERQRPQSFLGAYDPVKDEWREFERESLETDNVDTVGPKHNFRLRLHADKTLVLGRVWATSL